MKLYLILFCMASSFFFSSCGCSGYGGPAGNGPPNYSSVLFLKDSTDTIRTISYSAKPGMLTPNNRSCALLIPTTTQTDVLVKTDKSQFKFNVRAEVSWYYWEDKKCSEGGAEMEISPPVITNISGGTIVWTRGAIGSYYYETEIIDSLIFVP